MRNELWDLKDALKILVVEAHPDDAVFFAGGTITKLANKGHEIVNLCSTYGEKGTLDISKTREEMIEIEKREAQRAAKILGIGEILYLGIPDGELLAGPELRRRYTEVLRKVQPDIVFSFDPYNPYDPHSDHQAAGRSIYEASYTSHFHLYFPEQLKQGLKPHFVTKFFGWNSPNPNTFVDITETLETKIRALEQYESQMQMLLEETRRRVQLAQLEVPILDELSWQEAIRLLTTISSQETGKLAHYKFAEAFNGIPFGTVGVIADLMKDIE